ncbi:MAG: glycerol-3-phosphate dehydrogenase/oxidase [Bacteroidia bacterium]|nr:glycerol-3-phosphate dehydrogenase/oxidase [Bacteroidia bacterium]MDW8235676.1 glycerol-3-phosphate dehydrogenase/oxidase [Bacteroidia bacterium]
MKQWQPKLVIIGAGSSGLGTALAAARRGWKVLVLDAGDIAGGTSSASTKLIHGGVRYLENALKHLSWADWQLVREALRERAWMLQSHSSLCWTLPIVLPVRSLGEKAYYGTGLKLYDYLSYPYRLKATQWIERDELYAIFPQLKKGFIGGWRYYDGQFMDRLYAVHLALFLKQRYGVEIRTYHRVVGIHPRSQGTEVKVQTEEGLSYTEEADVLISAAGPWADELRKQANPQAPSRMRLSRGSHIVVPATALPIQEGFLIPRTKDGRILFVLPWLEETILVGTTEVEVASPENRPGVPPEEEAYLTEYMRSYFDIEEVPVVARFAGLRPLVAAKATSTARLARSHVVEVWKEYRLVNLMGGKWTTFRAMGEDALRTAAQMLDISLPTGEPVSSIEPDLSPLHRLRSQYAQPILSSLPYTEGELYFWQREGWGAHPYDIVEGRWLLPFIDQRRAQDMLKALHNFQIHTH